MNEPTNMQLEAGTAFDAQLAVEKVPLRKIEIANAEVKVEELAPTEWCVSIFDKNRDKAYDIRLRLNTQTNQIESKIEVEDVE